MQMVQIRSPRINGFFNYDFLFSSNSVEINRKDLEFSMNIYIQTFAVAEIFLKISNIFKLFMGIWIFFSFLVLIRFHAYKIVLAEQ